MLPKFWNFFSNTKIKSLSEACRILDTQKQGIPFAAIEYLYEQPSSKALTRQIVFTLNHAYSDFYYDAKKEYWYHTPLWYAIVAESHLSRALIDPIINLYTITNNDWDFLNEQGMYVLGQLAKKYGDEVVEKVIWAIDKLIERGVDLPYLFLFDVFYYADAKKYKNWFLETLQKNFQWRDIFIYHLGDLQIKEAIPIIKNLLAQTKEQMTIRELEGALEMLKKGPNADPDLLSGPYCEKRGEWKQHYKRQEHIFYEKEEKRKADNQEFAEAKKIGRNEPCPCGSGKKYKRCCGG